MTSATQIGVAIVVGGELLELTSTQSRIKGTVYLIHRRYVSCRATGLTRSNRKPKADFDEP
jgi:hypothetical protein